MGGGSSTFAEVNRDVKSDDRRGQLRAVNKFLLMAYYCCSQVEAVLFLLSNNAGLKHFSNFVASQHETEYLDLFMELEGIQTSSNSTLLCLQQQMKRIVEEYIHADSRRYMAIPSNLIRNVERILSSEFHSDPEPVAHVLEVIEQLRQEMVARIAHDQFPSFLSSKHYQNWQANERGIALKNVKTASDVVLQEHQNLSTNMSTIDESIASMVEDPALTAGILANNAALQKVLLNTSWLSALLSAVEVLPISFLLCQATKGDVEKVDIPRFPVLYANKFVEKMFGFPRGEFVGKPFDALLRCPETEKEKGGIPAQLEALTQQNQVTSAVLTRANSKGVPFKNLVASKPIFDPSGACVYMIYLMFDLSDCTGSGKSGGKSRASSAHSSSKATDTERQNSDVTVPASTSFANQNSEVFATVDRFTHERTKIEKLLHILPKYINPEVLVHKAIVVQNRVGKQGVQIRDQEQHSPPHQPHQPLYETQQGQGQS